MVGLYVVELWSKLDATESVVLPNFGNEHGKPARGASLVPALLPTQKLSFQIGRGTFAFNRYLSLSVF